MLKALTIKDNEKFLRQVSKTVSFKDNDLQQNLKDIKQYCIANNGLYALACIQLGIPKRIVYIKSTKPNDTTADEKGLFQNQNFEGFSSTVISHELDHLDGIFHMDRAKKLLQMPASERIEFRKQHPYKIISKDCEFDYGTNESSKTI